MPRIQELCEDLAERFAYEPTKVAGYARDLREAGLLSTGARGRHAPDATPLDTARLVIAMMLRVKQAEASEVVRLFGGLRQDSSEAIELAGHSAETFEDAMALLLRYSMQPYDGSDQCWHVLGRYTFSASIGRALCHGLLSIGRWAEEDEDADEEGFAERREFTFIHSGLVGFDPLKPGAELPEQVQVDLFKYRSGFHEVPSLQKEDFIGLGQVLAGRQPLGWRCLGWTFEASK